MYLIFVSRIAYEVREREIWNAKAAGADMVSAFSRGHDAYMDIMKIAGLE